MRKLSHEIGQSCHIAVASEDQIVVITRIERPGDLGFSVRIGYRREIARATSGLVLFAYQNDDVRRAWLKRCRLKGEAADSFVERANVVRERGHHEADSDFVRGIVDLSAPILRGETAVAALTCPFVHSNPLVMSMDQAVEFISAGYLGATVLVVALFAFWGMSNSLNDVLIPQFRRTFLLADSTSALV